MMSRGYYLLMMLLALLLVYLFVTAPVPLDSQASTQRNISISKVLEIANAMNSEARSLYAGKIVGPGKKQSIKFDENWDKDDVEAGPLPAQFLRLVARELQRSPVRLGLYLGSDYPINSANRFSGEQAGFFDQLKASGKPRFFYIEDTRQYGYMFADVAVVKACVSCHNEHDDSPKQDWRLDDVMGATTWTYPHETISLEQALELIKVLRNSFRQSYSRYLDKVSRFRVKPVIGERWPGQGFYLPSVEQFMQVLDKRMATETLTSLIALNATPVNVKATEKE